MLAGFFSLAVGGPQTKGYKLPVHLLQSIPSKSYRLVQFRKLKIYRLVQFRIVIH